MALPENQTAVADHSAVATDVQTATKVADTAAVVATAVAPEAVQQAPSGVETAALSIEDLFGKVTAAIPGASALAGFTIPAEVATHAAFSLFHFFQAAFHLGKAHAQAQAQKTSVAAKSQ